jgi:hypothetical protein
MHRLLVSFDIDGTLETGDPPGPIPLSMIRSLQSSGVLVGSCSDRTLREQQLMWEGAEMKPNFTVVKTGLLPVRVQYGADKNVHIGDTTIDEWYAAGAGFSFVHVSRLVLGGSENSLVPDWASLIGLDPGLVDGGKD